MKSKSIFLMAVSLGFGLVAAIGITQVMGRNNQPVAVPEEPKLPILVAVQDIDIDAELTPEMFVQEEWPARLVGEGVATTFEDIEGMVTRARIGKKQTLNLSNLLDKTKLREKRIPVGYKVIGIKMGGDDHLDGLLEAGDLVDIMVVARGNRGAGSSAKTFLRKVRVWSIGSKTKKDVEQSSSAKGSTVVGLLVTEKQAERIILAEKIADLKLAMRGKVDAPANQLSGGTNSIDDEGSQGNSTNADIEAEIRKWQRSMNANNSNPVSPAMPSEPVEFEDQPEQFQMVIFNGDGPTAYTFDKNTKSITRTEGFSSGEEAPAEEDTENANELDVLDLDDDEEDRDSEPSDESLDSEPNS